MKRSVSEGREGPRKAPRGSEEMEWHGSVTVRYKHKLREVMVQRMRRQPRSLRKLDLVRSEPKPTGSFNTYGSEGPWYFSVITTAMQQRAPVIHQFHFQNSGDGIILTYRTEAEGRIVEQRIISGLSVTASPCTSEEEEPQTPASNSAETPTASSQTPEDTLVLAVSKCALPSCVNTRLHSAGRGTRYSQRMMFRCRRCLRTYYCDQQCSGQDWTRHKKECRPPSAAKNLMDEVISRMFSRAANMEALRHLAAVRSQHGSVVNCWFNVELVCPLEEIEKELAHLKRVVGMIRRKLERGGEAGGTTMLVKSPQVEGGLEEVFARGGSPPSGRLGRLVPRGRRGKIAADGG